MKIVIATGIYPPEIGGPAQYAKNLKVEFEAQGHNVKILTYQLEKNLPMVVRHIWFFLRCFLFFPRSDLVVALDTFSVAMPAVAAARFLGKKIIIRTGGDFLWEWYVERTGDLVLLKNFYRTRLDKLNLKERIVFKLSCWTVRNASRLIFSTDWQRKIWLPVYGFDEAKTTIVENYYGQKEPSFPPTEKNYIAGARPLKWKNAKRLAAAFEKTKIKNAAIVYDDTTKPFDKFMEKVAHCYAVILASLGDVSPNLILDAIRHNKPFILTRETGLYERLRNVGLFADPENTNDIAEKISYLAEEKNYEQCRQKIENFNWTHTWRDIANEFLAVYSELHNGATGKTDKLLMISTDRKIFEEGSAVQARMIEYGKLFGEIHIIIFNKKNSQFSRFLFTKIEDPRFFKTKTGQISKNVFVYPTSSFSKFFYVFDAIRLGKSVIRNLGLEIRNCLITCQDPFETGLAGWRLAKKFKIPLKLQIHTDLGSPFFTSLKLGWRLAFLNFLRFQLAKFLLPRADKIRVVSNRIKNFLQPHLKIAEDKIEIRPIKIDGEKIKNTTISPENDLRKKYPQFNFIALATGRLEPEKNFSLLLDAWRAVVKKFPHVGLVIVGSGSLLGVLKLQVIRYKLQDSIIFEKWLDNLAPYYKTADVFLNTSLYEGYCLTRAEARAAGLSVISTDVGAARELGCEIIGFDSAKFAEKIIEKIESKK